VSSSKNAINVSLMKSGVHTVPTVADMKNVVNPNIKSVSVKGNKAAGDGGEEIYHFDSSRSGENNGGTVLDGWVCNDKKSVDVRLFGAVGDGVTDDTPAVMAALSASDDITFNPSSGAYMISSTVPLASKNININGNTRISAMAGFTGDFLFQPSGGIRVNSNGLASFTGVDGVVAFGNTSGSFQRFQFTGYFEFALFDYNFKFDGTCEFPLNSGFGDAYSYNARYAHAYIKNTAPTSGQSAMTFGRVVDTAPALASTLADTFVVVDDATATTDSMTWGSLLAQPTGWDIMRKPAGSVDANAYEFVEHLNFDVLSYVADKSAGVYYDYVCVVSRVGIQLYDQKAVNIGVLQSEYCSSSLVLENCRAVTLGSLYNEWRGNTLAAPCPKGYAIRAISSELFVGGIWTDSVGASLYSSNSSVKIANGTLGGDVACITTNNTLSNKLVDISGCTYSGVLFRNKQAFQADSITQSGASNASFELNHTVESIIAAKYRGAVKAKLSANSTDGILTASKFDVSVTNKEAAPIFSNDSVGVVLTDGVLGNVCVMDRAVNRGVSALFSYTVRSITDVSRKTETGFILISGTTASGAVVVTVGKAFSQQAVQSGTLAVTFGVTDNGTQITLNSTITTSGGADAITLYLYPVTSTDISNITIQ